MRAWKEEMERLLPWPLVGIRRARLQLAGEGEPSSGMVCLQAGSWSTGRLQFCAENWQSTDSQSPAHILTQHQEGSAMAESDMGGE